MFVHSFALLALLASCQGRAVNISNTWVLPEEGFPVFYRYFRDRISWYEADAVCQFHHANLVTVDTTAQYDAVRAYLKELDISSAVWVGLIRSNPDGDFTWTDYRGLSGEGYWSAAPDARAAPLCAAADPAADYRWEARACGGPTVASFICELPVPQWALGNEGCMVRALPALTILYLPESAAVQLTADCGLAGVKKVQCTGNVNREDLLKELSCNEEDDTLSTLNPTSEGTIWVTTDITSNSTDFETTTETSIDEDVTVNEHVDTNPKTTEATSTTVNVQTKQAPVFEKLSNIYIQKNVKVDLIRDNNFQSNDIPKLAHNENFLTIEQSEKLEDEKNMHHKMLHDELAKHGNFETIFTQPTDHFVPPLVMAKAKMSDDMTVLSLAEKHAQQLAEQRLSHLKVLDEHKEHYLSSKNIDKSTTEEPYKFDIFKQPLVMTLQPIITKDELKKDKIKSSLPKKYKEKLEDPKSKYLKIDGKLMKFDKTTEKPPTSLDISTKNVEISTIPATESSKIKPDQDTMELTVILKEPTKDSHRHQSNGISINGNETSTSENKITESPVTAKPTYVDDITKDMSIPNENSKLMEIVTSAPLPILNTEIGFTETSSKIDVDAMKDVTINHEIIKITIVNDDGQFNPTHTVFEVTTLMPEFKDAVKEDNKTVPFGIYIKDMISSEKTVENSVKMTAEHVNTTPKDVVATSMVDKSFALTNSNPVTEDLPPKQSEMANTESMLSKETHDITSTAATTPQSNKTMATAKPTEPSTTPHLFYTTKYNHEVFNITETYEDLENNSTESETIDDLNSPLLSGANEPIHRPNRSRRPQPPNRLSKFNPFRILG